VKSVVQLRDTVFIRVPPERVWAWLTELPRHYRAWHPSHVDCRYVRGDTLKVGAVLQVEEQLHGKAHALRLHADAVVPQRLLRYSGRGFRGGFILEPAKQGTRFTAELEFGLSLPLVGRLLDVVLGRWLANRLSAFQAHMREEGVNLKQLLEAERAA
jgi:hypothetical protein